MRDTIARIDASAPVYLDDEITQDVVRALREDALTADLVVHVETRSGGVHLRGTVPTLEDAENAENAEIIASRVEGANEIREELVIMSLRGAAPP